MDPPNNPNFQPRNTLSSHSHDSTAVPFPVADEHFDAPMTPRQGQDLHGSEKQELPILTDLNGPLSPGLPLSEKDLHASSTPAPTARSKLSSVFRRKEDPKPATTAESDEASSNDLDPDKAPSVSFLSLFRFATPVDWVLMAVGSVCAVATGVSQPLMAIIFGDVLQSLSEYAFYSQSDPARANIVLNDAIYDMMKWFGILAGATLPPPLSKSFCGPTPPNANAEIAWFDSVSTGDLTSRISGDVNVLQEGIGSKLSVVFQDTCCFIAGFAIAFAKGWRLALVLLSALPLIALCGAIMAKLVASKSSKGQDSYAGAGGVAEEVISGIRTVMAFGGQEREADRYHAKIKDALHDGTRKAIISGAGVGTMMLLIFLTYSLGFWYAIKLASEGVMTGDAAIAVFFSLIIGAMALGKSAPSLSAIANAQGAAAKVFQLIARERPIDPLAETGIKLDHVDGQILFRDIKFSYPTRPDVPILKCLNLDVEAGQTVALVGASGSGKSTIVSLLERFYDPLSGDIFLDGINIKDINVRSLRTHLGIVSQEPILFGETIKQNILWGAIDDLDGTITDAQIEQACRDANAWDFISNLQLGLDSPVGEKGSLLSGGQKQRIAIARAIIRNPRILLLDEATSALDSKAERLVQDALDRASKNRTTIVSTDPYSSQINEGSGLGVLPLVESSTISTASGKLSPGSPSTEKGIPLSPEKAVEKRARRGKGRKGKKGKGEPEDGQTEEEILEAERQRLAKRSMPFYRLARMNIPEKWYIVFGAICAAIDGAIMPCFSIVFSKVLAVFGNLGNPEQMRKDGDFYACLFLAFAAASFIAVFGRVALFEISGERLTSRVRMMSFRAMIYQDAAFFDDRANGTGILCSKLATESERIKVLSGRLIGVLVQSISTLVVGFTLAFTNGWQLTLVVVACIPILVLGSILQMKSIEGFDGKTKKAYDRAAQTASETVSNLRTVATLCRERMFIEKFNRSNDQPHRDSVRAFMMDSVGSAFSQTNMFLMMIIAFFYGSRLVIWGIYTVDEMFQVVYAIVFAAMGIAQAGQQVGDVSKAKVAALSIFDIVDRQPVIDARRSDGQTRSAIDGYVDAHQVDFSYPTCPHIPILHQISLTAYPGQTVALVGNSGSGKSTMIALAQRLYDVLAGSVSVEKVDTREWHLQNLRSKMALVGQEPVLFDMSVRENIRYGKPDATNQEVEYAARSANIHDFVQSLPDGYETTVGERGEIKAEPTNKE
ncbi:hypothetical protein BJ085DRAFT_33983 [Dimargaris cristalligena]|uniref:P-loop containing nucleoside triphosphate hydrolase protein n=1 Tax=Dimargaris cristalligena TaxID=215637 RepID=A0A4P9ZRB7_9FUNG|nr:hypothetical protein BJ085DRAFT_33983 [Dimargaris cristalligena]|eukprot:RKP35291.1 hypothetical protein BJ085DRAFT_33983 [Dimargaris cristalligena]